MIAVYLKRPHEEAVVSHIENTDDLNDLVGGDFEVMADDHLEGISLIVNEEARGVQANNFPITSEGYLDWVYGPCVFVKADGSSLTDEDIARIRHFLSANG